MSTTKRMQILVQPTIQGCFKKLQASGNDSMYTTMGLWVPMPGWKSLYKVLGQMGSVLERCIGHSSTQIVGPIYHLC